MGRCISYHTDVVKEARTLGPNPDTSGVLEWIDQADRSNRTWARNTLAVFAAIVIPLLAAVKLGLLPQ
jgi:hypothetical protein